MTAQSRAGVVIVGAGQAGLQLAVSLRQGGYQDPVTMIGAEDMVPYQRPPLSKAYLAGTADRESLALRLPDFYPEQRIGLVRGDRVQRLELDGPSGVGGEAITGQGRRFSFERLALAVGARPRRLEIPGASLAGVCYLRDWQDAELLRGQLPNAGRVVVIGGGYIGLEVAAVARAQAKSVVVVEATGRLLARTATPLVSEFYRRAHVRRGVQVLLGAAVREIRGTAGRAAGVELDDGSLVPADLVLVGIGVVPRTGLAQQIGLACGDGILVDTCARTSLPSVVAAGDCAAMPGPLTGGGRIRLESVQNAVSQARTAAATLLGRPGPGPDVPWFWSDQFELKLQAAGLNAGYDQYVLRGDPDSESFSVLYYRGGRLLGVDAVNRAPDYMAVRSALASGKTIAAGAAGSSAVALKDLITSCPAAAEVAQRAAPGIRRG